MHGLDDCVIRVSSPNRHDRRTALSTMDVVLLASEVLEDCEAVGMGGHNGFRGEWRVVVTRAPVV